MHSVELLNKHLNCFSLPQQRILLCLRSSFFFSTQSILNEGSENEKRNGSGKGKELSGILCSSARFIKPPRSEERGAHVLIEEAKKVDFRSKLRTEQRIGRQQEDPKTKTKKNDKFCALQIYAFDARLARAATERRRRDRGREEGGDEEDEQQRTFSSYNSTLSSTKLHPQNITVSSTFATPPFTPFPQAQLSAPSILVGTPPKPLTSSSPPAGSSSLA
ncbi:uncharacterized protein MONOS_5871 [Monocercomonoides exilis]|uniref:uncharacterized protein n=1 Tax=Monocercomonoides exilis TaxID=2049356 RepID=UPI00355A5BF7|nr:hypothetical protein MONOS_5871 [Monocercomonoides exilis]|eukprot:MONOS_5871.1-p1 / transcript=MONOS_5871.1 / gene=MONOS_5871 / organism=Monocercomonoides_exilis_PA203 / gene_product=unspecified product / transcript_product=unspecified product / location=Mono_scaffold00176:75821-76477(-) / protein_length=219 / sequence_SO=supercontig / SO=protein_coding / is_pseudo=false